MCGESQLALRKVYDSYIISINKKISPRTDPLGDRKKITLDDIAPQRAGVRAENAEP